MKLIDNPTDYIGELVHVCGWDQRHAFKLVNTDGKTHTILARNRHREYKTTNDLRMTKEAELNMKTLQTK